MHTVVEANVLCALMVAQTASQHAVSSTCMAWQAKWDGHAQGYSHTCQLEEDACDDTYKDSAGVLSQGEHA